MVNNLEKLKPHLDRVFKLNDPDLFFHLELIQRKKEVPDINKNSNIVKSYAVKNYDYLVHKLENEIIPICEVTNARAMINLNPKSFRRVTLSMLRKLSEYIEDNFYEGAVTKIFDSCTAASSIDKSKGVDKFWLIDIDTKDPEVYNKTQSLINLCSPVVPGELKVKGSIETKNGFHIFTNPFNMNEFTKLKENYKDSLNEVEVKKDCLTNLYIPDGKSKTDSINS
jgi:hypothetical protein